MMLTLADPLTLAGIVIVAGFFGTRYWQRRSLPAYYLIRVAVFAGLTVLLLKGGVVPYRTRIASGSELSQLFVGALEVIWWLGAAWVGVGFFRAFIVWGRQPRESKLVQDLLGGLIYLVAGVAIVGNVFDLPVQGLLATSGAAAILIGLALQSSLGDVFSGVVLNVERPYRVGDWIIVDDVIQGEVIETNWRATHMLTASRDIAVVPNSVIAKSKLVNCSAPTLLHGTTLRVKLDPSTSPAAACRLVADVLLSSAEVVKDPEPRATVKDLSAETLEIELAFFVPTIADVNAAHNEVYERLYRAAAAAGVRFSSRFATTLVGNGWYGAQKLSSPERLIEGIALFSTLTAEERGALMSHMQRREFEAGATIANAGVVSPSLCIVSDGVVIESVLKNGNRKEVGRLAPGEYFGEHGLLTGEALQGEFTALTRVVIYEISKAAVAPLLSARPEMASELSRGLARRDFDNRTVLSDSENQDDHDDNLADRVAKTIKRFFSIN